VYAPEYAPPPAEFALNTEPRAYRFVMFPVSELGPHPSYARHNLSVPTFKLAALEEQGEFAFSRPLLITQDKFIIDGYARWELAKRKGRSRVPCAECDLTSEEALEEMIREHRRSQGLNDFIRIELALDLESHFKDKAVLNQQTGGRLKGLSKLTGAEKVNSRTEVARVAEVSLGNVHKVKYILEHACSPLKEAARTREISINLADKWSHEPEAERREYLRLLRIERGLRRKARHLVAAELARTAPSKPDEHVIRLSDFVTLASQLATIAPERSKEFESIEVKLLDGPDCAIYVTEGLIRALTPQQEKLVR
jgi:hypothetical protein